MVSQGLVFFHFGLVGGRIAPPRFFTPILTSGLPSSTILSCGLIRAIRGACILCIGNAGRYAGAGTSEVIGLSGLAEIDSAASVRGGSDIDVCDLGGSRGGLGISGESGLGMSLVSLSVDS